MNGGNQMARENYTGKNPTESIKHGIKKKKDTINYFQLAINLEGIE